MFVCLWLSLQQKVDGPSASLKQQVDTYSLSGREKQNTTAIKRKTAAYKSQQNQATKVMMCSQVTVTAVSVWAFGEKVGGVLGINNYSLFQHIIKTLFSTISYTASLQTICFSCMNQNFFLLVEHAQVKIPFCQKSYFNVEGFEKSDVFEPPKTTPDILKIGNIPKTCDSLKSWPKRQ